MNTDSEFNAWQRYWQSTPATGRTEDMVADLKARVEHQSRRIKYALLIDILITVVIGGAVTMNTINTHEVPAIVLAIGVWIFIFAAWTGALWLAHGTWSPLGETTSAFVDLSLRRCRSNMQAASLAVYLYAVMLVFMLAWKLQYSEIGFAAVLTSWPVILIGWIGFPAIIIWKVQFRRKQRDELGRLLDLQKQLHRVETQATAPPAST